MVSSATRLAADTTRRANMPHSQQRPQARQIPTARQCRCCFAVHDAAPRLLTALLVATASATPARPAAPEPVRSSQTLIVTTQDNGSSVILRQGETLKVVLSGNAGTGYSWDLVHQTRAGSNRSGWKAGRLQLRYWRPWEGAGSSRLAA